MKRQKVQWILLASVILGSAVLLGLLIIGARWEKLYSVKQELYGINYQIQSIESALTEGNTWDDQIKAYLAKSRKLNDMFPLKEDQSLSALSDLARDNNMEVLSVKSQPKVAFMSADQLEVIVDGKKYHTVTISLHMKGKFKDLVGYLLAIKKSVPAYLTVEGLQLRKIVATSSALDISLEIKIYLLT